MISKTEIIIISLCAIPAIPGFWIGLLMVMQIIDSVRP